MAHVLHNGANMTNSTTFPFPGTDSLPHSHTMTTTLTSLAYPPADLSEADDNTPDDVPVQQPGPSRGRGRGRGRVYRGRGGKIAKPAPVKPVSGRGRRHKLYESVKAQAAHERMQELKSAYSTISKALKPAVQEIAERTLNQLNNDPAIHQAVPEYDEIQGFLKTRLDDTKKLLDLQLRTDSAANEKLYQAQQQVVNEQYIRCLVEECDDRYDQLLVQLDTLEYLFDNGLPIDLPAEPEENQYLVKEVSQKQIDEQSGPYIEVRDGIEVPFPGRVVGELMTKEYQLPEDGELPAKRKATDQPEGQPSAKIAATTEGSQGMPAMPRHASGLLSAVEALEERASTPAESSSNAPTPVPEPADAPSPGTADNAPTSGEGIPADALEIPPPRYATGPDEYGVRIVARRNYRNEIPNNRIVVPNVFEWDDLDIGFRDSANCVQKGAIKAKRGKYLGKPGSNFMFIDRRVGTWDSTQSAGQFDEELIKKHALHPTLGIVLPTSINEEEPPKPPVSGWKSTLLRAPNGASVHASRTIPAARRDRRARKAYRHIQKNKALREYCEEEGIDEEAIAPSEEERENHRRAVLVAKNIDPDAIRPEPSEPAVPDFSAFDSFVDEAIFAAAALDAEEEARSAASKPQPSALPYDAIRDVFSGAADPHVPEDSGTSRLSLLADMAEVEGSRLTEPVGPPPAHYEPVSQLSYPQQMEHPGHDSPRPSDFLRTALNPPPADYGPPPMVSDYAVGPQPPRTPFSSNGPAKALPALRPMRSLLGDAAPVADTHGTPVPQHHNIVMTNSGAYFPPNPSRPFHNGYPAQDPMTPVLQPPIGGPFQVPQLTPAPPERLSTFSASPPPYSGMAAPLAHPGPPILSAPAPPLQQPAIAVSPHSRPGSSSASSTNAAASAKYRKLEPAPTPPHRLGHGGTGQELRTVHFDYREAIKDYSAVEAPPRHGPTHIRGWTHNNLKKPKSSGKDEDGA